MNLLEEYEQEWLDTDPCDPRYSHPTCPNECKYDKAEHMPMHSYLDEELQFED